MRAISLNRKKLAAGKRLYLYVAWLLQGLIVISIFEMCFEDTLRDTEFLKKAMIENDVTQCSDVVLRYENKLRLLLQGNNSYPPIGNVPDDPLSKLLMPEDVPVSLVPKRSKADGNCLYNSASIAIYGSDELCNILRLLVAGELYVNANYYACHPHFQTPFAQTHYSHHGIFALTLSCDYKDFGNKENIVRQEAIATCTPQKWGAFLQIMALSTVLGRPLFSVYPPVHNSIRAVLHGKVFPRPQQRLQREFREAHSSPRETIYIMFTRDSNLNSMSGVAFQPNHFVPLFPAKHREVKSFLFAEDEFPALSSGKCQDLPQDTCKR